VIRLIQFQASSASSFTSTGLSSICLALICLDYSFLTKDGIIKLNSKYKWDNVESWYWKKDHYNVIVLKIYVPHKFSKKSPPKLRKIELNVSQKQRDEIEKLLIQYVGQEAQ